MNRKRYSELKGVSIDAGRLPPRLRPLVKDFREWCFITDDAVAEKADKASTRELRALIERCGPELDAVESYALAHKDDIPVPHEAAMVQVFLTNFYGARSELWLRESKRKK